MRAEGVLCRAPVWARWDGRTLWLVGSGATPVGEDAIRVSVDVGPGVTASVRSVAATIVYAARGVGTRWDTEVRVGEGATLDWAPEPMILTERARHVTTTTVHAAEDATVTLDEALVLGRTAESPGTVRTTLDVRIADRGVLLTSNDNSLPGWSGPGGTAGAAVVASRLRLDPDRSTGPSVRHGDAPDGAPGDGRAAVVLDPADGCRLAIVAATSVADARRAIDLALRAASTRD